MLGRQAGYVGAALWSGSSIPAAPGENAVLELSVPPKRVVQLALLELTTTGQSRLVVGAPYDIDSPATTAILRDEGVQSTIRVGSTATAKLQGVSAGDPSLVLQSGLVAQYSPFRDLKTWIELPELTGNSVWKVQNAVANEASAYGLLFVELER